MTENTLKNAYREYLDTLNIHVLRNVARDIGVYKPTDGKKETIIERSVAVLTGDVAPVPPATRGAPRKVDTLDPKYMRELHRIRDDFQARDRARNINAVKNVMQVCTCKAQQNEYDRPLYMGIMELMPDGCGFLRAKNCKQTPHDALITAQDVINWGLRDGDYVVGYAFTEEETNKDGKGAVMLEKVDIEPEKPVLMKVLSVNAAMRWGTRRAFDSFPACYPEVKIQLSEKNGKLSLRYLDLFAPIGRGQRALVYAPTSCGVDILLKEIASSVEELRNDGECLHLISLLVDERPEEITEFRRVVYGEDVYYTTFEQDAREHLHTAKLVFARAKRLAEMGEDVVILLNSLTRLVCASDACSETTRTLPCGLSHAAFGFAKECLSQARNLSGGGSITVIAVVACETGNPADEAICAEFETLCNCRITLQQQPVEQKIYPIIDVQHSYTHRAEALLSAEEYQCAAIARKKLLSDGGETLDSLFRQTANNAALLKKIRSLQ